MYVCACVRVCVCAYFYLVVGYMSADLNEPSVGRLLQAVSPFVFVCVCVCVCVFVCMCVCIWVLGICVPT